MENPLIGEEVIVKKGSDSEYRAFITSMEWVPIQHDSCATHVCSVVDADTLEIKNPLPTELTLLRLPFKTLSPGRMPQV